MDEINLSRNVVALGQVLIEIEELVKKMGGCIGTDMDISQRDPMSAKDGFIKVKCELYFRLPELHEYTAQSPQQEKCNGV